MFSPACLNSDGPHVLHSPHLLKLKVQYFSLPLVGNTHTHIYIHRAEVQPYDNFKPCLQYKALIKKEGQIRWRQGKTGRGRVLVWCGFTVFGQLIKTLYTLWSQAACLMTSVCSLLATRCLRNTSNLEKKWKFTILMWGNVGLLVLSLLCWSRMQSVSE